MIHYAYCLFINVQKFQCVYISVFSASNIERVYQWLFLSPSVKGFIRFIISSAEGLLSFIIYSLHFMNECHISFSMIIFSNINIYMHNNRSLLMQTELIIDKQKTCIFFCFNFSTMFLIMLSEILSILFNVTRLGYLNKKWRHNLLDLVLG